MNGDKVAVVLATYNSEKYIDQLLQSLVEQTYDEFICYIHDDESRDNTKVIINDYKLKYPEKFKILEYDKCGSAKKNFMSMLKYVKENYVMFCDHDDVWNRKKIECTLSRMKKIETDNANTGILVFSDMQVVDENLNIISDSFMRYTGLNPYNTKLQQLLIQNVVPGCTSMINKKLKEDVMKCERTEYIRMHDQWCALVASVTGIISFIDKPLLKYRQHGDNVKGADSKKNIIRRCTNVIFKIIDRHFFAELKEWHNMMQLQALELSKLPDIGEESRKLCVEFYELRNKGKLQRIKFYLKNDIHRERDNWWFLICC